MLITASLVLYNNDLKDINRILSSVLNSSVSITLYVIDNSPDRSIADFVFDQPLNYIHSNSNLGYGKGHNVAIRKSIELNSNYHLVLNPDVYFDSDVVEQLLKRAEKDSNVGLIMPNVNYPNGERQFLCKLLPSPLDLLGRRFKFLNYFLKNRNSRYELRSLDYSIEQEVPSLSGCFMFIRTSELKKINGFDERYFMYMEDVDICRRIGENSKLLFYPHVNVIHRFEKASYKNRKLFIAHIRSSIQYFNKWGWIYDTKRKLINSKLINRIN